MPSPGNRCSDDFLRSHRSTSCLQPQKEAHRRFVPPPPRPLERQPLPWQRGRDGAQFATSDGSLQPQRPAAGKRSGSDPAPRQPRAPPPLGGCAHHDRESARLPVEAGGHAHSPIQQRAAWLWRIPSLQGDGRRHAGSGRERARPITFLRCVPAPPFKSNCLVELRLPRQLWCHLTWLCEAFTGVSPEGSSPRPQAGDAVCWTHVFVKLTVSRPAGH